MGRPIIFGGSHGFKVRETGNRPITSACAIYNPKDQIWNLLHAMGQPRADHTIIKKDKDTFWILGKKQHIGIECYHFLLPFFFDSFSCLGGFTAPGQTTATTEIYSLKNDTSQGGMTSQGDNIPFGMAGHCSATVEESKEYAILGGIGQDGQSLNNFHMYQETTGQWSRKRSMPQARKQFACGMVETPDGPRLMVAGGYANSENERK